jgi:hypothetical protein
MIEFFRDTLDDVLFVFSDLRKEDWLTVIIMGIVEISFIVTIVMLVSTY